MITRFTTALLACCLSLPAFSQPKAFADADLSAAARLRDHALNGTGAFDLVASLTSEVGHRLAGSEGDRAAVAWALTRMKALGFQNVRTQDVMVPQWVRGSIEAAIVSPWRQRLQALALGGSVGTGDDGVKADVVLAANLDALKKMDRSQVEGRIVFINHRMQRTRDGAGYGAAVPGRTEGASVAASLGALAIVIRSIGTDNNRTPHTGTVRYAKDLPRIPAAALSNPDADMLERQIASGKPVSMRLKITARELAPVRSANVIGEILGTDPAAPVVLLGAHLDSWDVGTGAIDDAAGVAIVMEAARLIREMKLAPKRTVRVVLFANEEFGLSGGQAYAQAEKPEQHLVAFEADLGAGPVWRFDTGVADAALTHIDPIMKVLKPLNIERGSNDGSSGSDLTPLKRLGVPVFELQHDASIYFDYHHTENDTLDKVDAKVLDRSVAAYAAVAYLSSIMKGDFGRWSPPPK